jgi:hypothetical protein
MADLEKQQDAVTPVASGNGAPLSPSDSDVDLEKAETIHQVPTSGASTTRSQSRTNFGRTRSVATDGYSAYNLDGDESDQDEGVPPEKMQNTKSATDPFEVRWDGPDDNAFPRNFNLARKWMIVFITSFAAFCV